MKRKVDSMAEEGIAEALEIELPELTLEQEAELSNNRGDED